MTQAPSIEKRKKFEELFLSENAARTWPADRAVPEPESDLRTPLQRDRDRIVHCKAFRRLKHKTQVFMSPEGDHYRTRLTHTLEVTGIGRTVARSLGLNEDLVEAIGLGHDLGHSPFGHVGEEAIDDFLNEHGSNFKHWEHSVRLITLIEESPQVVKEVGGSGLNLCKNVVEGIACHSGRSPKPKTLEGSVIRLVDRIAYLNHDIDDAIRAGVIKEADLPAEPLKTLGQTASKRIDSLVIDLVEESARSGQIVQSYQFAHSMDQLRTWMFENVYLSDGARKEHRKVKQLLHTLLQYELDRQEQSDLPRDLQAAVDWVAGMTDRYALRTYTELVVPRMHER